MGRRFLRAVALVLSTTALACAIVVSATGCGDTPEPTPTRASTKRYDADGYLTRAPESNARPPNIVMVVVDTLRADCVEARPGQSTPDMPFVASLAKRGVYGRNVVAPAPWTHPSLATLLTGLLPDEHGVRQDGTEPRLPRGITTYAEALANGHGYQTRVIHGGAWRPGPGSLFEGFEQSRGEFTYKGTDAVLPELVEGIDPERPFFLMLHTYDAHDPYGEDHRHWPPLPRVAPREDDIRPSDVLGDEEVARIFLTRGREREVMYHYEGRGFWKRAHRYFAKGYAERPNPRLAAELEAAYRAGASWVDREIERAVGLLEAAGMLENTLLVVTADHGEAFGEHGILCHGRALYDELIRVPFVAVGPGRFRGGKVLDASFGLVDIFPTIFDAFGLPPLDDVTGQSVLAAFDGHSTSGRPTLSMERLTTENMVGRADAQLVSVRTETHKYIVTFDRLAGTVTESLFDLAEDPGEQDDLAAAGGLARLTVPPHLADAVESARDRIWGSVAVTERYIQLGYGADLERVNVERPAPLSRRTR